jgi:outer membrane protein OmpA-like peptidoglycan-associated protein
MINASKNSPSRLAKALVVFVTVASVIVAQTGSSFAADYPPTPGPTLSPAPTEVLPPVVNETVPVINVPVQLDKPITVTFVVNGKTESAILTFTQTTNSDGLKTTVAEIKGDGWSTIIATAPLVSGSTGNNNATLTFEKGVGANVSGTGFAPLALVSIYVFSEPVLIGKIMTDAKGNFKGTILIPENLATGLHTIQLNGFTVEGKVRTASIAVTVKPKATLLAQRFYFGMGSSQITAKESAKLALLAKQIKKYGNTVVIRVTGYSQPTRGSEGRDLQLSVARAKAVAQKLQRLGVKVKITTKGGGRTTRNVPASRYALVEVFRK